MTLDEHLQVLGIDIAPTAVEAANIYLKENNCKGSVAVGDFFKDLPLKEAGQYNLGYDCTFLCAIPPSMRESWAKSWHALLSPGGELITLIFPIKPGVDPTDDKPGPGPPFGLSQNLVSQLLSPLGFELISAVDVPEGKLARGATAKEIIARWRRT